MSRYAESTQVGSDRSRVEIERTLVRYGASGFMYGWMDGSAMLGFQMGDRRIQFRLPLPERSEFQQTETGRDRSPSSAENAYEQAVRQRWRALALVIKAKLEAVESGITEFDDEFLAHIVLPGGQTVGERLRSDLSTLTTGQLPPMLPVRGRGGK